MLKQLIIILFVFSSFSLLASDKIVLWNAHKDSEYLEQAIADFQKETGVEVDVHQFKPSRLREELLVLTRNSDLPEILYIPADFIGMHRSIGLSKVPSDWFLPALSQGVRTMGMVNNSIYGIPLFQGNHLMLFYNKTLVNEPARTWQELLTQAESFPSRVQFPITWKFSEMFWFIPFLTAFDGWPMSGGDVTLNTPGMVEALRFYQKLYADGIVDIYCNQKCAVARFKSGKSPYLINGDWAIHILEKVMGDRLGIATLPTINGKNMLPMSSSYVLAFPALDANSKKYQQLKKFSLFMQSKETQELVQNVGGLIPVNDEVLIKPEAERTENQQAVIQQMQQTRRMPNHPNMVIAWLAMSKGFNRLIGQRYSPEKTAKYMQKLADKEVERRAKEMQER